MATPELFFSDLSPIENNILEQHYNLYEGEPILIISLIIDSERTDEIKVYKHDNTDQLALDFCYKHKLGATAKDFLAEEIEKYLKIALSRSLALNYQRETENLNKNTSSQVRSGRKQTFSQLSMQVKQNVVRASSQNAEEKGSISCKESGIKASSPVKTQNLPSSNDSSPCRKLNRKCVSIYDKSILNRMKLPKPGLISQNSPKKTNKSLDKSARIMKKLKYSRYKELFDCLLPNTNDVISSETVKKSEISNTLKKILQPLLEELEDLKETLDFNEFYDAMEMLLKVLTPGEKSALFVPKKTKKNVFEISKGKKSRHMSNSNLYERGVVKKREFFRKIEKEKSIIEEAEMKECRFIPSIVSFKKSSIYFKSFNDIS